MILAAATIAEAIVVLTALSTESVLTVAAAEAAKQLILRFALKQTFKHLLKRCNERIRQEQAKQKRKKK